MLNQQRFIVAAVVAMGCSPTADPVSIPGIGGTTGAGGSTSTGGTTSGPTGGVTQVASGGTTSTGGTSTIATGGTTSTGGTSTIATGGTTSTGGTSTIATGGKSTSTGGTGSSTGGTSNAGRGGGASQTGGSAGAVSTGGSGGNGSTRPATPSAGCGKGGRPSDGVVTVSGDHIYTFPTTYDGTTPMPVVFGFHAAGNPIDQIKTIAKGTDLEKNYVMAFPKSAGSGWVTSTDNAKVTRVYDELLASYCVDTSRVFATGHSSGAQYIVQLLCAGEKRFRAVAPVASSSYCTKWTAIPTFLIHGTNDTERGSTSSDADGKKDLAPYVTSNACTMTTTPFEVASCKSSYNQAAVTPGCVEYQGCTQPMIWCQHNDGNYSGTNHGWPCFAANAMAAFFSKQ